MNRKVKYFLVATVLYAVSGFSVAAQAQTLITDFNDFFEDALYGSWNAVESIIDSGPDSYSITATGYGSNYVYIGDPLILGAGNNQIELDVTLSGPPEADGLLGPLIQLIDTDGTHYHYRWYGQLLGNHLLTRFIESPDFISNAGTVPGLNLDGLEHMHMELDPGGFGTMGAYTVAWNNLNLIQSTITPGDFDLDGDVDGNDFLLWQRDSNVGILTDWQNNYGSPTLAANIGSVPEPNTICLLVLTSIGAIGFRRPPKS